MKNEVQLTKDTKLSEADLSVRLSSALHSLNKNIEEDVFSMTISEFSKIPDKDIMRARGIGWRSIKELKRMFIEVGIEKFE
jgi:hypothetical protein